MTPPCLGADTLGRRWATELRALEAATQPPSLTPEELLTSRGALAGRCLLLGGVRVKGILVPGMVAQVGLRSPLSHCQYSAPQKKPPAAHMGCVRQTQLRVWPPDPSQLRHEVQEQEPRPA